MILPGRKKSKLFYLPLLLTCFLLSQDCLGQDTPRTGTILVRKKEFKPEESYEYFEKNEDLKFQ